MADLTIKACRPAQPPAILLRRQPTLKPTGAPAQDRGAAGGGHPSMEAQATAHQTAEEIRQALQKERRSRQAKPKGYAPRDQGAKIRWKANERPRSAEKHNGR
jgi:hypothetical protein